MSQRHVARRALHRACRGLYDLDWVAGGTTSDSARHCALVDKTCVVGRQNVAARRIRLAVMGMLFKSQTVRNTAYG